MRRTVRSTPFCIQKHAASHLHYDFRLGWNGVLKSWACAKGPSYNVKDRRLAVQVEDHPMEYGGFEGIIPAGQYGGGTVMLWDQGTWAPQAGYEDVEVGLREGHLKFTLDGVKMHGKWALIRMAPRPRETKPNWLLIKEHDDFERSPDDPAVTEAESTSVITGRSLEEIAANQDHVWNSKETNTGPQAWYRQDAKAESNSTSWHRSSLSRILPGEKQPTFLKPQLATEAEVAARRHRMDPRAQTRRLSHAGPQRRLSRSDAYPLRPGLDGPRQVRRRRGRPAARRQRHARRRSRRSQ